MKKNKTTILVLVIALFTTTLMAQLKEPVPLCVYKSAGAWFAIDKNEKVLYHSKSIYDVHSFSEKLLSTYFIENGERCAAYIDGFGKIVFKTYSDIPYPFSEETTMLIHIIDEKKGDLVMGMVDKTGKFIADLEYIDMLPMTEGLAYVFGPQKHGYIDKKGNLVIPMKEGEVGYGFYEGLSAVSDAKIARFGFIDKKGKQVIDYIYEEAGNFSEGLARVYYKGNEQRSAFGYINKKGNLAIINVYDNCTDFHCGRAFAAVLDPENTYFEWRIIDKDGIPITGYNYSDVMDFSEDIAAVVPKGETKWLYIDKNGRPLTNVRYTYAGHYKDGIALVVTEEGEKMFIDRTGKIKTPLPRQATDILDCRTNDKWSENAKREFRFNTPIDK